MKKNILFISLLLTFCFTNILYAKIIVPDTIKVGIILDTSEVIVACDKKYNIKTKEKNLELSAGKVDIKLKSGKVKIKNKVYSLPLKITSSSFIVVNKKIYRGNIIVCLSQKGKLNIVNEVDIEDYLKGILPKEANSAWPIEALKTQAVISRSYVLKNLKKHSKDGFDVCSTIHCQVYGGASAETKNCNQAVVETFAEVVVYDNKIAQTLFHSSCGGHTEDPKYVWNWTTKTPPYLKGLKDKYCKDNPNQNWTCTIKENIIREKLTKAGYKIGKIKDITTHGKTVGLAKEQVVIKHAKGTLKLNSYKFRTTVDPWLIKSTMINSIKKQKDSFVFTGNGWGHKVGLCQWGSKFMADKGFSYKQILQFYYPSTSIEKVNYAK